MQVPCPNCRTPVLTAVEQLFDVTQDPAAKQRFLSGRFNLIQCPNCRYQGQVATTLVYHDADKELLLSFAPMELALPQAEQERTIGKLVNEVVGKLPQEKRKGYLFNPKPVFTLQALMERVLEADGVTKEMLDAQRAKAALAQKFLQTPDEQWPALAEENDAQLDSTFFQMLTASLEATLAGGNQAAAQRMLLLRNRLMELSTFGQNARDQQKKIESAVRELQALGDKLTPDKLLDMVTKAEDEMQIAAYVSLTRPAMDYAFFEALTRRINKATGEEKERLTKRRELLLQLTQEIDQAEQARVAEASELLKFLMESPDLPRALSENVQYIDDTFMAVLSANLEAANKARRLDVAQRLTQIHENIVRLVQQSAPPEIRLINELLQFENEADALAELKRRLPEVNQPVIDAMTYLIENLRQQGQPQLAERLETLRGVALSEQMAAKWKK
jgi:hypothetical protein